MAGYEFFPFFIIISRVYFRGWRRMKHTLNLMRCDVENLSKRINTECVPIARV
ncbi:Uncharacterised protein [Serratia grimesii]|nr:Uncharacterised protein [Serratia grimesii]CAI2512418.1 Uncharacterised protein [Serratia grimesii]SUI36068.1 Uncharacterised protein [Serratia grimesii]